MSNNRICKILKISKPIIQAPMAWITSPKLVAAVSNAGGLGVIGPNCGLKKPVSSVKDTVEEMRKSIRKTRELTTKPFAMNVFTSAYDPFGYSKNIIDLCKEENVNILALIGGTSPKEIKKLKKDGFTVIAREINPTVKEAIAAEKAGADIIVATGCDEGGAMPYLVNGMTSITALISDAVKIPVLSAGGIVNEKLARAAKAVGAEGAYVGTRFMLSKECRLAQNAKDEILRTHPDDYIVCIVSNGVSRWRTLPNEISRNGVNLNKKGNFSPPTGNSFKSLIQGNLQEGGVSIDNTISLIKTIDSCESIVNELSKAFI
ncbi:2-nitropropane dioxygenase-like enzyme [Neocallimastix californiae]|uniref:2-nitropropane dioxygenase-like enzyme n=1 Tax=Neocallimastix californiae TaxID=1754190 RepID=A0A1Y2B5S7_9FUNG|nr:2-nitropropane dioxygenase-like enzyme [Neocallimastix californiae]|eukprot:ORY30046.1 2-nitropropane dioxygenase-like enzyme [Neocallimastix californiae]